MRKQNDWPHPLTEVLDRGLVPDVETVGQVVDFLTNGDFSLLR